jgi:hypothetical protein
MKVNFFIAEMLYNYIYTLYNSQVPGGGPSRRERTYPVIDRNYHGIFLKFSIPIAAL